MSVVTIRFMRIIMQKKNGSPARVCKFMPMYLRSNDTNVDTSILTLLN